MTTRLAHGNRQIQPDIYRVRAGSAACRFRQVCCAHSTQHLPKSIIEWRQLTHLVRKARSPEPSQTILLGSDWS
jgi:hypothetical protein